MTTSSQTASRRLRGKQSRNRPPSETVCDDGDNGTGAAEAADATGAIGGEAVDQEAQSQRGAEAGDRQDGVSRVSPRDAHAHDPDPEAGPELIPELVHHGPHRRPTAREIEEHNITHTPANNWCSTCVAAKATDDPHRRRKPEEVDDQGHEWLSSARILTDKFMS